MSGLSEQKVELHRRADEAFNSRDVEAYVACCDPEVELASGVTMPGGATYRGHDGVRSWHRDVEDVIGDEIRVEPEAYFDLGEHTISFHVLRGRRRHTGAEIAELYAHVCGWREGLMVYFKATPTETTRLRISASRRTRSSRPPPDPAI